MLSASTPPPATVSDIDKLEKKLEGGGGKNMSDGGGINGSEQDKDLGDSNSGDKTAIDSQGGRFGNGSFPQATKRGGSSSWSFERVDHGTQGVMSAPHTVLFLTDRGLESALDFLTAARVAFGSSVPGSEQVPLLTTDTTTATTTTSPSPQSPAHASAESRNLREFDRRVDAGVRKENLFPRGVRMLGQIKLGPAGRGKHAQDLLSRACRKRGFAVAIRHLLADKELERTVDLFFASE